MILIRNKVDHVNVLGYLSIIIDPLILSKGARGKHIPFFFSKFITVCFVHVLLNMLFR